MPRPIPLPRGWNRRVKSSILHVLAFSHYTFTASVARAANDRSCRTTRFLASSGEDNRARERAEAWPSWSCPFAQRGRREGFPHVPVGDVIDVASNDEVVR